jgi:hypothetical protein
VTPGPTSSSPAKNEATSAGVWFCQAAAVYSAASRLPSSWSSQQATEMIRQLPGAISRAYSPVTVRAASASMKCRTAPRMTATGRAGSMTALSSGCASTAAGSRRSAPAAVTPSPVASSARAWDSTTGSMSTYATRAAGRTARAAWWTAGEAGSPAPRSMNWPVPWRAAQVTAWVMNARFSRARSRTGG